MMYTRREALRLGGGAAASAVLAGLGLMGSPREAEAIIGIDDALLGAVVVAIASLGGYSLYSQYVSNQSLAAIGGSFSDYVSVTGNREAAIQAAMAAAALHGIAGTQPDFERAGNIIASGEGAFLSAMESASSTGRLALDSLVSGGDALVGMMRELVTGWLGSDYISDAPLTVPGQTTIGTNATSTLAYTRFSISTLGNMLSLMSSYSNPPISDSSAYMVLDTNWVNARYQFSAGAIFVGSGCMVDVNQRSQSVVDVRTSGTGTYRAEIYCRVNPNRLELNAWQQNNANQGITVSGNNHVWVTPDLIGGPLLPGVDRAADAPDVIGTAWDSVPIATDMVIDPSTGDITSAGSITLPSSVPTTAGDYAAALQGALAGVVADTIALPLSLEQSVTVATPAGVATMPISEAIASETSLQLDYAPDIPIDPVLPPVDVPEGPWTPAVELPFMDVWPFNMIYTFIETMSRLGGS